ncbi:MAG: hypothetical protein K9J25_09765 [Bacteroidales bacterium]|nr:hypothetical protein [Bacteroidales bacterium]
MDLKSAINIILKDLDEAEALINDLKTKPDFPELQIELARSKCKSAGDLIRLIGELVGEEKDEAEAKAKAEEKAKDEEKAEAEAKAEDEVKDEDEDDVKNEAEAEAKAEEKAKAEAKEKAKAKAEEKAEAKVKDEAEEKVEKEVEHIVADRFAHLSSRINEKVGEKKKTEGKTRTIPVNDLNKAIGINDRFYFIRELFNGNHERYRELVDSLNLVQSMEEALEIMNSMLGEMAGSEPAITLLELVERKLSAKEK